MRSPEELTNLFRANRLKVTPQRVAVFEALHNDHGHPTAEIVWDRVREAMPTVSLRTVYQVLNDLVAMDEVRLVSLGNGASRFDSNLSGHHHFVCRVCERVYDVASSQPSMITDPNRNVAPIQKTGIDSATHVQESAVHRVEATQIIFRGPCASCAK